MYLNFQATKLNRTRVCRVYFNHLKANRGSPPIDKERFSLLCEELRAGYEAEAVATGQERLLVTAAVAAGQSTVDSAYDIPRISAALDYIHIMAYDLHGGWENTLGHHSQVFFI